MSARPFSTPICQSLRRAVIDRSARASARFRRTGAGVMSNSIYSLTAALYLTAKRRPHRIDSDVDAAFGALALPLDARAGFPGSAAVSRFFAAARLDMNKAFRTVAPVGAAPLAVLLVLSACLASPAVRNA